GNSVPQRIAKQHTSKMKLLNRKPLSRDAVLSSWFSLRSASRFLKNTNRQIAVIPTRNATNQFPIEDCAKACTELTMPLRVRKVPNTVSRKVPNTSPTFQTFIIPRFSCIITECRNAVPLSHGRKAAFSTGSQAQYPPQPSTL